MELNRFKQLLESTMGEVKPLTEQPKPISIPKEPITIPKTVSIPPSDVVKSGQTPSGNIDYKSFENPNLPECIDFLEGGASPELTIPLKPGEMPRIIPLMDDVSIGLNAPHIERFIFMSKNGKAFCRTQMEKY